MKYVATLNGKKYEIEIERVDGYRPLDRGAAAVAPAPIIAQAAAPAPVPAAAAPAPAAVAAPVVEEASNDDELAAVISAAIAAYEAEAGGSTDGFVVRSIKRRPSNKWHA